MLGVGFKAIYTPTWSKKPSSLAVSKPTHLVPEPIGKQGSIVMGIHSGIVWYILEGVMSAVIERIAHQEATRASVAVMAGELQTLLGQRLTAAMAGVRDPKAVGAWARGEREPQAATERNLRNAYGIARFLLQVETPQTVRSWFVGMNPQLDDAAPAEILPHKPARVLQAARTFLADG